MNLVPLLCFVAPSGTGKTILSANNQLAVFDTTEQQRSVRELTEQYLLDVDIVIVEGFRNSGELTIVVERVDGSDRKEWELPVKPIAIVSDRPNGSSGIGVGTLPVLGLNVPDEVAAFICQYFRIGEQNG